MVLFDMVGDCDLQIPHEANSDPEPLRLFADAATELDGRPAPFGGRTFPVGDDHTPFQEAAARRVDLIDFDYGPGPRPGPTGTRPQDTARQGLPASLEAVGEAALVAIPQIR